MDTIVIKIKGLRNAACVSSIEYKLQQLPQMEAVSVDLKTSNTLLRSFDRINLTEVQRVVEENGFTLEVPERSINFTRQRINKERSLFYSGFLFFVLALMEAVIFFYRYALELDIVRALAIVEMILVCFAIFLGRKHIQAGLKQFSTDIPHMDSMLAVSSILATVYSLAQTYFVLQGYASEYDLYCAAVAGAIFFALYGKKVTKEAEESFAKKEANEFKLPKASLLVDEREYILSGNHLLPGDTIVVRQGEAISADGIIIEGKAELDEVEITGSSEVVSKTKGDKVFAETILKTGKLRIKASATGKDVEAVQLLNMAKEYASEPKAMQKFRHSDKTAAIFMPVIVSLSVVAALSWYFYSGDAHLAWKVLVSVMLGAYPCALGFVHSGALLSISKLAKEQGIILNNPAVLEQLYKISLAVFSKHEVNVTNCMELVQVTALKQYIDKNLPDFLSDGRVRNVFDLRPNEKAELIKSLRWGGEHVLVYGNKISDMPLLACGDVGVAVQFSGAEQFAQIVLPQDDTKLILQTIAFSNTLNKIYKRNSILAMSFNLLCLPLAVGVFYGWYGYLLEPLALAGVMLLSGLSVILSSKMQ